MEKRAKWLLAVTLLSVAFAALLVLAIYAILLALAVLAPEISSWPLLVILGGGVLFPILGLRLARRVESRASRRIASVLNVCTLTFSSLIIVGLAWMFINTTSERFLIPDGYKGDIFLVYGNRNCESVPKEKGQFTYLIPSDGILRVCGGMFEGRTRPEYYYERRDGTLERIRNFWPSTIHPTAENLANDSDVGIYFPRNGGTTDSAGCTVTFEQFYVGTKKHLLTKYSETDLLAYLRDHPVGCKGR